MGSCSQKNVDQPDFVDKSQLPDEILFEISKCGETLMPADCDLSTIQLFDVDKHTFQGEWIYGSNDIVVEVKNKIGTGGFRECYLAEVKYLPAEFDFACSPSGWVAKFYKENRAQEEPAKWSDCRKDVQAQSIARELCEIFRHRINGLEVFGKFPRMNPTYLVTCKAIPSCFSIEPRIDLSKEVYCKFMNNNGLPTSDGCTTKVGEKCQAFAHWTYRFTNHNFLLCDLQGTEDVLTDVQIASLNARLFGPGNLGKRAFDNFVATHNCNDYCRALGLKDVAVEEREEDEESRAQSSEDAVVPDVNLADSCVIVEQKDDLKMDIKEDLFSMTNYLEVRDDITPQLRTSLIGWMMELKESLELNGDTLHLAVKLFDQYAKRNLIDRNDLLLVGATTLIIASKVKELRPFHVQNYFSNCNDSYESEEIDAMEWKITRSLEFDINIPTPYQFLRRYEQAAQVDIQTQTEARFLLESTLLESCFIIYKASRLAASCLYLAMLMNNCGELWTSTMAHYTGYKEEDLRSCVLQLHSMHLKLPNIDES